MESLPVPQAQTNTLCCSVGTQYKYMAQIQKLKLKNTQQKTYNETTNGSIIGLNHCCKNTEWCIKLKKKKKMLESRPEDALDSLVKTVEIVETERKILKYLKFCY